MSMERFSQVTILDKRKVLLFWEIVLYSVPLMNKTTFRWIYPKIGRKIKSRWDISGAISRPVSHFSAYRPPLWTCPAAF